jgi:hypothetical protein
MRLPSSSSPLRCPPLRCPAGGQPPAGLSVAQGLVPCRVYFVGFSYYQLVTLIFNNVPLIMEFTLRSGQVGFVTTGMKVNSTIRGTVFKISITN